MLRVFANKKQMLKDFVDIPTNSVKPFAWGGQVGFFYKKADDTTHALKGVCTHMECNITYKPACRPCHQGWFDENGKNVAGPPSRWNSSITLLKEKN